MKKTVFLKSTLRQLGRSLFLLLLVGVISFAAVARVGEYSLISQEQEQLSTYYRSIGTLVSTDDSRIISDEVASYLEQAPYIAYTDHRQFTSGVLQNGIYNADNSGNVVFHGYSSDAEEAEELVYHLEVFFYGTYTGRASASPYDASVEGFEFTVDEVISGYPEYVAQGKTVTLYASLEELGDGSSQLKSGERYLLHASMDAASVNALMIINGAKSYKNFAWKTLTTDMDWFLPAPSNLDLTQPEYIQLADRIRQSHDNACALDITATADMSAMSFVNLESGSLIRYYLNDGRWLDHEDDLAQNRVIVIHEGLATARNLKVGDTVTLVLRDISFVAPIDGRRYLPYFGYQFELRPIGYEYQTQTETFEIVGIYSSLDTSSIGTFAYQRAYIPLSVFPEGFAPAISADDAEVYSLVLDSPAHEEEFQTATRQALADMGYFITFTENSYQTFKNATDGIQTGAKSNVIIFAVILAVCLCLACFVYFRFRRKDIAISRALGVPAGRCMIASVLPLALVAGVGIVAGSALAWSYTQGNAETLLATLVEAAGAKGATATLSTNVLVILDVVLIAALLVLALIFAAVTVKKPVLSQLQGGRNKR